MQPQQQISRIDLVGLRSHIVKKIGVERSKKYFNCLQRYLNLKLTKSELEKSCFRFLGGENLPLHNQLIRSILKNSCHGKAPPPHLDAAKSAAKTSPHKDSGCDRAGLSIPAWSNGVLPPSPRRSRTSGRDRKHKDRPSPLGTLSKPEDEISEAGENRMKSLFRRDTLIAPLGIPLCSAGVGGGRIGNAIDSYQSGGLTDTENLRKRVEQIAAAQGVGGVSMECANILNNFVDVYLKKLIKSCVDLVGTRSPLDRKVLNGDEAVQPWAISMLDFQVAMELNPLQLGEDWPMLLAKISTSQLN